MPLAQNKTIRGLQNIRTRSGAVDQVTVSYQAYTKITCLEMEKCRREKERTNLMTRLKNLDERLRSIALEQKSLLRRLGMRTNHQPVEVQVAKLKLKSPLPPTAAKFKLRY